MIDTNKYEGHTEGKWRWVDSSTLEGENTVCELSQGIGKADAQLMADAPLLLEAYKEKCEEVKQLRGQLEQAREFLWWCYDNERFGWNIDEESWNLIGRLLGADTDHNDNEWSEEE